MSGRHAVAGELPACCSPTRERDRPRQAVPASSIAATSAPPASDTVEIPGGTALAGTDSPVLDGDGEGPLRRAKLSPFRIDKTAVTNARFERFVNDTGYVTEAEHLGTSFAFHAHIPPDTGPTRSVVGAAWWRVVEGASWRLISGPGSEDAWQPDHPVVHVSWNDARAFAKWASGRLPTEAEWEHAARGGLGDVRFPWGDREPNDTEFFPCNIWQGNFPLTNTAKDGFAATAPAASFGTNGYGLFNMAGNVWEWTSQPFGIRSGHTSYGTDRSFKALKGGSFLCHSSYCFRYRIAARAGNSPDSTTSHQGFRLVYD